MIKNEYIIQYQQLQNTEWYDDPHFKHLESFVNAARTLQKTRLNRDTRYRIILRQTIDTELIKNI